MRYGVRIVFTHQGERLWDILGPFDHYLAELVCVDMAGGYMYGPSLVHVERALIVEWTDAI